MKPAATPVEFSPVAVDRVVLDAITSGAVVAYSLSGGKDSTATARAAAVFLDAMGHPRADRVAIHADLGRSEWRSTPETVERVAKRLGVPLIVARHAKHDMVSRWEARFEAGKRRYAALEIFNLIGPWSSPSLRFCTSEMKQQVIAPELRRRFPGRVIVSVVGLRRDESTGRRSTPISKLEPRWDQRNGTRLITWHPGVDWPTAEVFSRHEAYALPLHDAYTVFGSSRLSCAFCIMQSEADIRAAMSCASNWDLGRLLVELEAKSTFSFQPDRWLADVLAPILPCSLYQDAQRAKAYGAIRRKMEASLPADLRYVKGWPTRVPTWDEADRIAQVRETILGMHDLPVVYPSAHAVRARFAELMATGEAARG